MRDFPYLRAGILDFKAKWVENRIESTVNLASPSKGGGGRVLEGGGLNEGFTACSDAGCRKGNIGAKILVRMMG